MKSSCCRSFDGSERGYHGAVGVFDLWHESQSTKSRDRSSLTYYELKENEGHKGSPQSSDAPCRDPPDLFIGLVFLRGHILPVLLGGLEASPHEVVYDCGHAAVTEEWTKSVDGWKIRL